MNKNTFGISIALVLLGISARLLPHPANVAPIGAVALFAGMYLPRRIALTLPLIAMFLSDTIIGFYDVRMMVAVYGSFVVSTILGTFLQQQKKAVPVLAATTLGALVFYLSTNAAVWAFGTMYSKTFTGLLQSYIMALPFLRNSLIGDLFFMLLLVGGYESISLLFKRITISRTA